MLNAAHLQAIALHDPVVIVEAFALLVTFCFLVKTAKEARLLDLLVEGEAAAGRREERREKAHGRSVGERLRELPISALCNVGKAIPAYRLAASRERA